MAKGKRLRSLTTSFRRLFSIRSGGNKSSSSARSSQVPEDTAATQGKRRSKLPDAAHSSTATSSEAAAATGYHIEDNGLIYTVDNTHVVLETHTADNKFYPSLSSTCSTTGYRSSTMESVSSSLKYKI